MTGAADTTDRGHPIRSRLPGSTTCLKDVRDVPVWSMDPDATGEAMVEVTRLEAQLVELQTRVTAHGQTVEIEAAQRRHLTANWWAYETRLTRAGAHRTPGSPPRWPPRRTNRSGSRWPMVSCSSTRPR